MSAVVNRPRSTAPSKIERLAPDVSTAPSAVFIDERPSSVRFAALLGAYRSTGGTARGDDLARLLEEHHRGD